MIKSNAQVAGFLRRVAVLLELRGENPFKARSYRTAADTIDEMREPVATIARSGGAAALQKLPGIGRSIGTQIAEFVETGTSESFERLREEIPETAADLLLVRGIGIQTAHTLYRDFGVLGIEDLLRFAEGGGLEVVPGLAERSSARILASATQLERERPSLALAEALRISESIAVELGRSGTAVSVDATGQMRRRRDPVHAIELLAIVDGDPASATSAAARLRVATDVTVLTPSRAVLATGTRLPAIVSAASLDKRWPALVRTTGSPRHCLELQAAAEARGYRFRGFTLVDASGDDVELESEADFYAQLGLRFIPPEQREGMGEIEEAMVPAK